MTNDTPISEREREILRLVATGATNQQIADQLTISVNTVKVHLRNIFGKIGVVSRTEATVYAMRNGLVSGLVVTPDPLPPEPVSLPSEVLIEEEPPLPLAEAPAVVLLVDLPRLTPDLTPDLPAPSPHKLVRPLLWLGAGLTVLLVTTLLWFWRAGGVAAPLDISAVVATATIESNPSGRWITHTPLPRPRDGFAIAAYDPEGRLFVIGGRASGHAVTQLDRYDPQIDRWVALADKPTAISDARAISLRGRIYVPGGATDAGPTTAFEAYDPREQSWEHLPPLPAARSRYALAVWEGRIFLMGGWDGRAPVAEVFIYDPEQKRWTTGSPLPSARMDAGAAVVAGQIYVVGGEDGGTPLSESLRLDPSGDASARWERIAPMPQPIIRPAAIAVINSLLVFDAAGRVGWQYDSAADAWSRYVIPADAPVAADATLLNTSIYFVSNATAPIPGTIGEYRVIFTIFVPTRG